MYFHIFFLWITHEDTVREINLGSAGDAQLVSYVPFVETLLMYYNIC